MKAKSLFLVIPILWIIAIVFLARIGFAQFTRIVLNGGDSVFAAKSFAGKPIPSGPDAFTEKNFQKIRLQYYNKLVLDAYQNIGLKHPEKSAEETALLKRFVKYLANVKDTSDLLTLAQPLLKSNPQDPLVLVAIGVSFINKGRDREAEPYIQKAIEKFPETKYSKTFYWQVPLFLVGIYKGNAEKRPEIARLNTLAVKWAGEGAVYPFAEYEQRVFWGTFACNLTDDTSARRRAQLVQTFASQPKADPWIRHMMAGYHELESAWEARGGGYASTVTSKGWEGFFSHQKEARKHFTAAWKLHPKYPEPASYMIKVTTGERNPPESVREWFDRAVAGQMDYTPAYSEMSLPLQPRWGGSHEAMYKFGVETLETKRFDTEVPMNLYYIVRHIEDLDGDASYWKRADVYANMQKLFHGLVSEPSRKAEIPHYNSLFFVIAWRGGDYNDARKVLDELNGSLDESTIWYNAHTAPELLESEVYLRTSAANAQFTQADTFEENGKYAKAIAIYEDLLSKKTEPKAEKYLRHRLVSARVVRDLQKNEWATLPFESGLPGWQEYYGWWEAVDDGALTLKEADTYSALLLCSPVSKNIEVTGDIEFLGGDPTLAAGMFIDYKKSAFADTHMVLIHRNGVVDIRPNEAEKDTTGKIETPKDRYHFLLHVENDQAKVFIDGKEIVSEWLKEEPEPKDIPGCFGLTVEPPSDGGGNNLVRFRNLKMRQLR